LLAYRFSLHVLATYQIASDLTCVFDSLIEDLAFDNEDSSFDLTAQELLCLQMLSALHNPIKSNASHSHDCEFHS
jgi:hypothetical protein